MKSNEPESSDVRRIEREAAEWVAKKIGGFTAKDQDAFLIGWLPIPAMENGMKSTKRPGRNWTCWPSGCRSTAISPIRIC